jgi:hypothetical protein
MAGLDYSHVKEPDYDPAKLKQSPRITEYIKGLCEKIYERWRKKEDIARETLKGKEHVARSRNVYYDTDGIMEEQTQKFKVCSHCSGLNTILSRSDWGYEIFAVSVPRDACPTCIEEGYKIYRETPKGKYFKVYLQDRVNDVYMSQ